jgi:MoaA/NifB/PqqE/SkfB family radical SAM enzyme
MRNIEINIGNACNNACQFCMVEDDDQRKFVDFNIIKKEILQAKKKGFESIGFLGGEFTLHPDIFKIIKICKVLGFKIIHVISNGRQYQDQQFLAKLIQAGTNRFSVSIHSHLAKIEDDLTQRQGGFKQKIAGLNNLVDFCRKGLIPNPIAINLVINAKNYISLVGSLKYFHKLGINDFRLNYVWLHGRAKKYPQLFLAYTKFLPVVDKIIGFAQQAGINVSFEGVPLCLIKNPTKLKYFGELKDLKTEVVAYNNSQGKRENFNWQERKQNEFKIKNKACQSCQWANICDGVWHDYIKIFGWQEFNQ